jgi:hypothetical protein
MTVRELGARMDAPEFQEWLAYDRVDPLPDPWTQTGLVVSTLANLLGDGKRSYRPADFIPARPEPPRRREPSWRAELARFDRLTANRRGGG